ncbi:IS1 family transposase [Spongorhabdus nitratireducens]
MNKGIYRNNLILRTSLKRITQRIICFSTSAELHDKVIGGLVSKNQYQRV